MGTLNPYLWGVVTIGLNIQWFWKLRTIPISIFLRAVKNMSFLSVSAHVSKDKYVSIPHCPKFRPGPTSERPRICRCALRSGTWDAGGRWRKDLEPETTRNKLLVGGCNPSQKKSGWKNMPPNNHMLCMVSLPQEKNYFWYNKRYEWTE